MFRAGTLHGMEFGVVNNMCCYMCIMILLFGLPESMALGFSILKSPTREMVTRRHPGTFSDILIIPSCTIAFQIAIKDSADRLRMNASPGKISWISSRIFASTSAPPQKLYATFLPSLVWSEFIVDC